MQFSFLVTIALALVFLTLEIEKQLAHAGRFDLPIIYQVILASYTILMPNFFLTVWASSKNKVRIHSKLITLWKIFEHHSESQFKSDPPNAFVNAIVGFKNKWNRIDDEKLMYDQSNERKWDDFETLLQNLIFAIQALCIFSIHGKHSWGELNPQ